MIKSESLHVHWYMGAELPQVFSYEFICSWKWKWKWYKIKFSHTDIWGLRCGGPLIKNYERNSSVLESESRNYKYWERKKITSTYGGWDAVGLFKESWESSPVLESESGNDENWKSSYTHVWELRCSGLLTMNHERNSLVSKSGYYIANVKVFLHWHMSQEGLCGRPLTILKGSQKTFI